MKEKLLIYRINFVERMEWIQIKLKDFQPNSIWHFKLSECFRDCKIIIRSIDVILKNKVSVSNEKIEELMKLADNKHDKIKNVIGQYKINFGKE